MNDPSPVQDRQPSPGAQRSPVLPTSVVEASNPIDAEPLPPVHEEEESLQPQAQQPHRFQPLFTLVTDSTTRATHHPRVHYIFSDDDPDVLTEALAQHGTQQRQPNASSVSPSGSGLVAEERERPRRPSAASATGPTPSERVIVLDLVPKTGTNPSDAYSAPAGDGGYEVAWASSLSSDWAVVSAKISPMADDINASTTAGASTADPDDENPQQLILRIEGLGVDAVPSSSSPHLAAPGSHARRSSTATATGPGAGGRGPSYEERDLRMSGSSVTAQGQEKGKEDYATIIDEFDKRMGVLRKVVDAGLERQRRLSVNVEDLGPEGLLSGTHAHDWGAGTGGAKPAEGEPLQQFQGQAAPPTA